MYEYVDMGSMDGFPRSDRYGYQIIQLSTGAWYWTPLVALLDFVPRGKRTSTVTKALSMGQNNLPGVLKVIGNMERLKR